MIYTNEEIINLQQQNEIVFYTSEWQDQEVWCKPSLLGLGAKGCLDIACS